MWQRTLCLSLVSQSPLPQVSDARQRAVAGSTTVATFAGAVLPCGVHVTAWAQRTDSRQRKVALWRVVRYGRANLTRVRKQPALAGWSNGLHLGVAHLVANLDTSSARAWVGDRWGVDPKWRVEECEAGLSVSGASLVACVQSQVSRCRQHATQRHRLESPARFGNRRHVDCMVE